MNYINGLAILRRISPDRKLEDWLDQAGDLIAIDSGTGRDRRTFLYVDDERPRDLPINLLITGRPVRDGDPDAGVVGGCTDGWVLVDEQNNIRSNLFSSRVRAEEARARAKVTIVTEYELEEEEKAKPAPKARATEQVAASA